MIDGFVHFRKRVRSVFILGSLLVLEGCNIDPSSSIDGPRMNPGKPVPVAMLGHTLAGFPAVTGAQAKHTDIVILMVAHSMLSSVFAIQSRSAA